MNRSRSLGNRAEYQERDPLDSLSRTIADLEARIEGLNARNKQAPARAADQPYRQEHDRVVEKPAAPWRPERHRTAPVSAAAPHEYWSDYDNRQRAFERDTAAARETVRNPEAGTRDIAEALVALREDLKKDFAESITRGIGSLKQDGDIADSLHAELDELRVMVRELPGEESMRRLEDRWDGFESRLAAMDASALREELSMLSHRLDDIRSSIGQLPSALPLHALEDKIKLLVGAIDAICRQTGSNDPEMIRRFGGLEERLDEISRAIVAVDASNNAEADRRAIDGLESRFDILLDQLDAMGRALPGDDIAERLDRLSGRVEELSGEQAYMALMDRLDGLSQMLETRPAPVVDERLYDHLEQIARKVDALDLERMNEVLADKLEGLSHRIDSIKSDLTSTHSNQDLIHGRLEDLTGEVRQQASNRDDIDLSRVETGLANIAARLDEAIAPQDTDDETIRSLEEQVSELSRLLAEAVQTPAHTSELVPRLTAIEERLSETQTGNQDMMIEAARRAAEAAIDTYRQSGASSADISLIENLVTDLRSLEELSRRSEERNTRTIDAVHDTLVKIADRLEAIEGSGLMRQAIPGDHIAAAYPSDDMHEDEADWRANDDASREEDPDTDNEVVVLPEDRYGSGPHAGAAPSLDPADETDHAMDDAGDDTPLEPGSGAPDIETIMAKVRQAQKQGGDAYSGGEAGESGKADFIAAARRAARAAASDTALAGDVVEPAAKAGRGRKNRRVTGGAKRSKRPFILAAGAILLAVVTYPLLTDFFTGQSPIETASVTPETATSELTSTEEAGLPANEAEMVPDDEVTASTTQLTKAETVTDDISTQSTPAAVVVKPATPDTPHGAGPQSGIAVKQTDGEWQMSTDNSVQPVGGFYSYPGKGDTDDTTAVTAAEPEMPEIAMPPEAVGPLALRKAAAEGDSLALFEVGVRYTDGRGVPMNLAEAAKWYELSAELGFAPAQYRLANFYEKGNGVERDLKKARTWYQMAAEQGNASAMHNLAVLFAMKHDGVSDYDSSATWFKRAAEFGVRDSQYNLAILHARGNGVPQDLIESYKWFAIAAASGDKDAARKRDEVGNAMRPEQLEEARKRVEDWTPAPLDETANSTAIPDAWKGDETTTASIDMKRAISNIQAILTKNGFDTGGVDGIMGDRTITAIKEFQSSVGMEPTGEVTEQLVKELLARNS